MISWRTYRRAPFNAVLAVLAVGAAVPAAAETLQEALVSAYSSNPTLLAQRARLRAQDELVPQALSNWRPVVTFSGDVGRNNTYTNNSPVSTSRQTLSTPKDLALQVQQPLYRGGRTGAQTRQAEATVEAERALLAATEQRILLNVATAYENVVQTQAVLDLTISNEQVLQRQLDATNDRFRVGEVTRTDVAQAESRLSGARADRTQAEGNLRAAVANYITNVGHPPGKVVAPDYPAGLPATFDQARNIAFDQNPNVVNAQYNYQAASHGIDLVEGELLPTVSLNGTAAKNYEYQGPRPIQRVAEATLNVTVPIYQQGQVFSRVRQQKHLAGQQRITVDVTRRDVIESVTRDWEALQTAKARILSFTDQINAAQVALEGVQRESQVGSRTVLDVLNAEQELLNARVNLVQAQHDEIVAAFQVKSDVGQMTAQALGLPVEIYDPVKHYQEVRDKWVGTAVSPNYADEAK